MNPRHQSADVLIVGAGIMGAATAYHLLSLDPGLRVILLERDPGYRHASSALSLANIRTQFDLEENTRISRHTLSVIPTFSSDMAVTGTTPFLDFRATGNLICYPPDRPERRRVFCSRLQTLGCRVEDLSPRQIRERFPLLDPPDCGGATWGPDEGYLDAFSFLTGYLRKARQLGARVLHREVTGISRIRNRVTGVRTRTGEFFSASTVINCAGAWASILNRELGIDLPVEPVKRQVFVLAPAIRPPAPLPLVILPSGLYFRSETGNLILCGKSLPEDPAEIDFSCTDDRWEQHLWPELARAVPSFDRMKTIRCWAGLYAVNRFDGNAFLGDWPGLKGWVMANGFSGHGLQQAPAVGRYTAERVLGKRPVLDLSVFSPRRYLEKRPLKETCLV